MLFFCSRDRERKGSCPLDAGDDDTDLLVQQARLQAGVTLSHGSVPLFNCLTFYVKP